MLLIEVRRVALYDVAFAAIHYPTGCLKKTPCILVPPAGVEQESGFDEMHSVPTNPFSKPGVQLANIEFVLVRCSLRKS